MSIRWRRQHERRWSFAQHKSSEVGSFGEVLFFQRHYGATRRDRTGDLLITNPVLAIMADVDRDGFRVLSIL